MPTDYYRDEATGEIRIKVSYPAIIEGEKDQVWIFKDYNLGEYYRIEVNPQAMRSRVATEVEQFLAPQIAVINGMMIEGEKITKATPYRITTFLRRELADFLD
jgi:hypothetical protein